MSRTHKTAESMPAEAKLYRDAIEQTARMVKDPEARALSSERGLQILNLTWEDTGRFKGSAVGPNISDMTIQVQWQNPVSGQYDLTCMPVIRYPNFADVTGDISPDRFFLLVGNQKGTPLRKVTLRELLGDMRAYLSDPTSWAGMRRSLLAPDRDSHVLVSAQACFLPVPKSGTAEFNPVLFNYQSRRGDPAVLTILATREGTSVTVIDNVRDQFHAGRTWGQRLFFNAAGQRASLTAERRSEFVGRMQQEAAGDSATRVDNGEGLNMVLLIQVPLKQKAEPLFSVVACASPSGMGSAMKFRKSSDVEDAVIGHGRIEGPFTEIDGLEIERDDRFPIRVTVQFYKATSNGIVSSDDMAEIAEQIQRVYRDADYVGSLVVEGETGRPTEHAGPTREPPGWWDAFWERHFANTGQSRVEAIQMLQEMLGTDWTNRSEAEADAAIRAADASPRSANEVAGE